MQTKLVLGQGILAQAIDLLDNYRDRRLLLVSDKQVASLYTARFRDMLLKSGYNAYLLAIPDGEAAKTLDTLTLMYEFCYDLGVERGDVVLAVGGGAVGDVAGMLAGTYLRGLEFVQVPTSLVAMVSASVGGKVGVNFRGYKNLIGLFKYPSLVLADLDTLTTLPVLEFRSGLGELITVGVLGMPAIFESLESNGTARLNSLIAAAIQCKGAIVEADPLDRLGIRAQLNLGHTFGHALEKLSNFTLPHGLAVAVGLHIASRLSAALGLCPKSLPDRIRRALLALDLPTTLTGYSPQEMKLVMRSDKKSVAGQLQWVLPVTLGKVALVSEQQVPSNLLEDVLRALVWEGAG